MWLRGESPAEMYQEADWVDVTEDMVQKQMWCENMAGFT